MTIYIENIEVTEDSVGSPVTYIPPHAGNDASHPDSEQGHVSSFNEYGIWVRFKAESGAKCDPQRLRWG